MPDPSDLERLVNLMRPMPSPFPLIRLGGDQDGAYLLPNDLEDIQACFSPGVNNSKNFEDELALKYGIPSHMCDFSSDLHCLSTPLIDGLQTFAKKWLDPGGGDHSISLEEWVSYYCPGSSDLILQMDIEGAEYRNLLEAPSALLKRFRIIIIELHWLCDAVQDGECSELYALLRKLGRNHRVVHAHPNNCCGEYTESATGINIPNVIELTFLRVDRFGDNPDNYFQPIIPHPLDISRNTLFLPPIHLSPSWLHLQREPMESTVKKLEDRISYLQYEVNLAHDDANSYANCLYKSSHGVHTCVATAELEFESADNFQSLWDVAKGKPFSLPQPYSGFPSYGIVEDDPCLFFHTALERHQSITIDLLASHRLEFLILKNRGDCYPERAKNLFYCIHDCPGFALENLVPIFTSREFLNSTGSESVISLFGAKGRFFTIYSSAWTALHFSSIKIMVFRPGSMHASRNVSRMLRFLRTAKLIP